MRQTILSGHRAFGPNDASPVSAPAGGRYLIDFIEHTVYRGFAQLAYAGVGQSLLVSTYRYSLHSVRMYVLTLDTWWYIHGGAGTQVPIRMRRANIHASSYMNHDGASI